MEQHGLMSGLPSNYALLDFRHMAQIKSAAEHVLDQLTRNEGGNQFLVVLGITESARQRLDNGKECLGGITFRFMWEGTTALIKVIPTLQHDVTTRSITEEVGYKLRSQMGISRDSIMFGNTTTHKSSVGNKGKQPDDCFWPPSRQGGPNHAHGWPTLVVETGVSESLPKLREDAHWWFHNSSGQTRFVLVVSISRRQHRALVEKWQLAPPGTPRPITRFLRNQLSNQPPPRVQQPAASQQPFCAQEIMITAASVTGAPLVLNFETLFDRPRQGQEADIVLDANDLRHCARVV
ncbi:uncharacterized protein LDX57_011725 [Aspergillus melleus]|uniref:uncharacterized protein n=1 Tax=Aspergillus melleus TaxID=138277 RepID=UPI001E8DBA9C|nr:uncharacterized protein LDX57_011725 [Aspergillus melleus]KAH8434087.1 hypothetical protein LDX57_011725 [Aspergillus melleus]